MLSYYIGYILKKPISFDSFLKNRFFFEKFSNKGFIRSLKRKNNLRDKKLLTLKNKRPLFFKVNNFLSPRLNTKKFSIIYRSENSSLKKKEIFKELTYRNGKTTRLNPST